MQNSTGQFPELETENLLLRSLTESDADKIFQIRSDEEIGKYLDRALCKSKDEALEFIKKILNASSKGEVYYWAVCLKGNPELAGTICLWNISYKEMKADIGFELLSGFQGKGIMNEVLDKIIDFGFNNLKLKAINGEVDPDNLKSIRLMERKGFKLNTVSSENSKILTYSLNNSRD